MSVITTEKKGNVLLVVSDNPPVNALGHAVREGLDKAIDEALADDGVEAIVIACDGRTFFAGADITEFSKGMKEPFLPEVCAKIEACTKPVIAAIHGTALGGGLEIALSCHYRVAVPSAKCGLPEVNLGILPGAGGTQRLPRVVGVEPALDMIVSGKPISAKQAAELGLVDKLVGEDSLRDDALAFAGEKAGTTDLPRTSEMQDKVSNVDDSVFENFKTKNARRLKNQDAPQACVEAVKAATELPFEEGVKKERELFFKLVTGTQSAALRHIFFAERKASKIDDVPEDTKLVDVKKVGIIGAGTMGGGIAMNFLSAGIPVTILEMKQEAIDRGFGVIRKNYERSAQKGRITGEQVEAAMGALSGTLDYADLADCDLVIEAVFENMDVKKDVFTKLDEVVKDGAILASNTSYLSIDDIAAVTKRPEWVLGTHFFSPANVMKLLEVVRGEKTNDRALATVMDLAKKIKKVAVVSGVCFGFIGNRMLIPRQLQADQMSMEGAAFEEMDRVLVDYGLPMGPFQMIDLAGVDIGWHRDPSRIESVRDALCAAGRFGQKSGGGFYDYDEKRRGTPSPEAKKIIDDFREKSGTEQKEHSDQEILERLLYPQVNEGAKILEEGIAQRASDIDVVYVYGYGWPPYTGGPMFWADTVGLDKVVSALEGYGLPVCDLLRDKAAKGEKFN